MNTGFDAEKMQEVLDAMSARDLQHMRTMIDKRLSVCVLCNADGAIVIRGGHKTERGNTTLKLMLCPACIAKHRLRDDGKYHLYDKPENG
jgi:ABC-type transport system involved in Fe-S cluster assembly fused permease/ATPase subunit